MLRVQSTHGVTPAYAFRAGAGRRRQPLAMYAGVAVVAAAIAAMAVIAMELGALPSVVASKSASSGEAHVVGSIMVHSAAEACQHRTFNNRTGQIADAGTPCNDVVLDAKGIPVPLGTVRTIDSISKSFR